MGQSRKTLEENRRVSQGGSERRYVSDGASFPYRTNLHEVREKLEVIPMH
jgi:hypothetical protein